MREPKVDKKGKPFVVFHRNWWKRNKAWPNGLEPCAGPRHVIGYAETEEQARDMCRIWNANHKPGPLSDKAEFDHR